MVTILDVTDGTVSADMSNAKTNFETLKTAFEALEAQVVTDLGLPPLEAGKYLTNDGDLILWAAVQATLVSGTNIKTVNGTTILGSGDLNAFEGSPYMATSDSRSSNTILAAGDKGKLISCTSSFTQTFTAAATLGATWFCYIKNAGTGDITLDPNGSETIDGLTSYVMYPGEVRFVQCDGTAFYTVLKEGFLKTFTTIGGTFYKPPGYAHFIVDVIAAGSGGGGGTGGNASSVRYGGSGGAGGARRIRILKADIVGVSETVTVGAGSAGGAGGSGAVGASALAGGNSSFGSHSIVYGGGPGQTAESMTGAGGGGGVSVGTSTNGGRPISTYFGTSAANTQNNISEGGAASRVNVAGGCAEWGGAAGGSAGASGAVGTGGGASVFGGSGGGSGGGVSGANAESTGMLGGVSGAYAAPTDAGGSVNGGAGAAGADGDYIKCGSGGAGGGSQDSGTGGVGGAGGVPGGGGGGGGGGTTVGGAGGAGGRGEVRIWGVR